jgi:hypothetical protein
VVSPCYIFGWWGSRSSPPPARGCVELIDEVLENGTQWWQPAVSYSQEDGA